MNNSLDRREFLKLSAVAGVAILATHSGSAETPVKQMSVCGMTSPPLETVRFGFVGNGGRGTTVLMDFLNCRGTQCLAVCDIVPERALKSQNIVEKRHGNRPETYTRGPEDFRRLCERDDLDLIINATPWDVHVPICLAAMNAGKHTFTEVPAAITVEDCWKLVDASERTRKHCVMLENCCYDESELMVLGMVRDGLFGDLVHGECGYIHDLRDLKLDGKEEVWRSAFSEKYDGNLYPTHGLGPIAQYMNINRGDQFERLVSMSSAPRGLKQRAIEKFGAEDPRARKQYRLGDVNTTLVHTALGRTIMVQHDTTSPRPYTRLNQIQGTKGMYAGWPDRIALSDEWGDFKSYKEKYQHPLWKQLGEFARSTSGHGGMDYVMAYRLIDCLRRGLPMDMDVYDAAAWSCLFELTCRSVAGGNVPIEIPDFTRGQWKSAPPLGIVS